MKLIFILTYLFFCSFIGVAQDVPRVISYQGVLVGADGKPISGVSKNLTFRLNEKNGSTPNSWTESFTGISVSGGLFQVPLGINSTPKGFPSLDGEYELEVSVDGNSYQVPLYSSVSALNIPDNIVTSTKIKDGEVKAEDLHDMGASVGQVLTKTSTSWRGADILEQLPNANNGDILVFEDGRWQVKEPSVPSGVPVGTIVAFGGENIPDGWLLCDGRELNAAQNQEYKALFDAIGTAWGGNLSLQIFRIPDLQGMFLRGVDGDANEDPDKTTHRSSKYLGGNEGNKVGSYQLDAFQEHRHFTFNVTPLSNNGAPIANYPLDLSAFSSYVGDYEIPGPGRFATIIKTAGTGSTEPTVGPTSYPSKEFLWSSETRPKNVYVNYIIKAR